MNILVIVVDGSHLKITVNTQMEERMAQSRPGLNAKNMVDDVRKNE